jgi:hypothetical protein
MSPSSGVTAPITGFACAMTQFLGARDIHALSRVSCHDRQTTERLWETSAALSVAARNVNPDHGWGDILRHPDQGTHPVRYAYAYARSLSALTTLRRTLIQSVSFGMWTKTSGWSSNGWSSNGWKFCEFGVSPSAQPCDFVNEGLRTPWDMLFLEPLLFRQPRLNKGWTTIKDDSLIDMFVSRGLCEMDYACVGSPHDAEIVIAFWMEMGVAPTLSLFGAGTWSNDVHKIRQGPLFQRFHPRVNICNF